MAPSSGVKKQVEGSEGAKLVMLTFCGPVIILVTPSLGFCVGGWAEGIDKGPGLGGPPMVAVGEKWIEEIMSLQTTETFELT